jgi:hypothetical protein
MVVVVMRRRRRRRKRMRRMMMVMRAAPPHCNERLKTDPGPHPPPPSRLQLSRVVSATQEVTVKYDLGNKVGRSSGLPEGCCLGITSVGAGRMGQSVRRFKKRRRRMTFTVMMTMTPTRTMLTPSPPLPPHLAGDAGAQDGRGAGGEGHPLRRRLEQQVQAHG